MGKTTTKYILSTVVKYKEKWLISEDFNDKMTLLITVINREDILLRVWRCESVPPTVYNPQ